MSVNCEAFDRLKYAPTLLQELIHNTDGGDDADDGKAKKNAKVVLKRPVANDVGSPAKVCKRPAQSPVKKRPSGKDDGLRDKEKGAKEYKPLMSSPSPKTTKHH